jgi:hypothetical protein
VIVEWRAVTVGFLDELLDEVNSQLGLRGEEQLSLAQMLEAGTWKVSIRAISFISCSNNFLGRSRDCGSFETQHQGASYHDTI